MKPTPPNYKLKAINPLGFTLIELLVVIAIIGILASVVMLSVNNARVKGRDAKRIGDVRQIITALEQYYIHNGSYPTGTASVASVGTGSVLSDPNSMNGGPELMVPGYLPLVPDAPSPADGSCGNAVGRGNNNYWYDSADDGTSYTITFCLAKDAGQIPAGVRTAGADGIQ